MDSFNYHFENQRFTNSYATENDLESSFELEKSDWIRSDLSVSEFSAKFHGPLNIGKVLETRLQDDALLFKQLKLRLLKTEYVEKCLKIAQVRKQCALLSSYADFYSTMQTFGNKQDTIKSYCIHALNHLFKTRDAILKNNERIKRKETESEAPDAAKANDLQDADVSEAESDGEDAARDQGFTRPKVLILVPMKNTAFAIFKALSKMVSADQVENKKRFEDEFGPDSSKINTKEEAAALGKPIDFVELFGGNNDDHFRIGIKLNRKSIKLFANFYASDILIASPLGLRTLIGSETDPKKQEFDFLSSIEMVIVDGADVIEMQNFEHLVQIFKLLNKIPKEPRDADFSRIKHWYLDGKAPLLRQTIVYSSIAFPACNALFTSHCRNVSGLLRLANSKKSTPIINQTVLSIPQIFFKLKRAQESPLQDADDRFEFFTRQIAPEFRANRETSFLVVIPQYYDFVRVRNWLKEHEFSFGQLSEYRKNSEISRTRTKFFQKQFNVVLLTERFHFYNRYLIRGAHQVIFYGVPTITRFYPEYIAMLQEAAKDTASDCKVSLIFSVWDKLALERLVGKSKTKMILQDKKDIFRFV